MNGWPNSIQFLGISAIYISIKMKSLDGRGLLLPTSCQQQLHSYKPIPVRPVAPPFQAQKMGPQPKEFNRERNEETTILIEMGIFSDRNPKPISVESNKLSGHIAYISIFI